MDRLELEFIIRKEIANRPEISLSDVDSEALITAIGEAVEKKLTDEMAAARSLALAARDKVSETCDIVRKLSEILE